MKQASRIADLKHLINTAVDEEVRLQATFDLAFEYRNNNPQEAFSLLENISARVHARNDAALQAELHYTRGVVAACSFEYEQSLHELFEGLEIFRRLGKQQGEVRCLRWIAITYRNIGMLVTALEYAEQARTIAKEQGLTILVGYSTTIVGDCHVLMLNFEEGVAEHLSALDIARKAHDTVLESQSLWSLARVYEQMSDLEQATQFYRESYVLRRQEGDLLGVGTSEFGLASVLEKQGKACDALKIYLRLLFQLQATNFGPPQTEVFIMLGIGRLYMRSGKPERARPYLEQARRTAETIGMGGAVLASAYLEMANFLKLTNDYEQALHFHEQYHTLTQDLSKREAQQTSQYFRQAYEFDKARQQNEIYRLRNEELAEANKQNERLLRNVLPEAIAQRMKAGETTIAEYFDNVTVLFADIVGFTELAAKHSPSSLVTLLNRIFSAFDIFSEQYNLEKIKTIGDAYMIVGGLPSPTPHHAESVANMALEMIDTMRLLSKSLGMDINIRVGIHTGAVIAGVIGQKKFSYDLWGDTVNIASRMESRGEAGKIHVSEAVYLILKSTFLFDERGEIQVKGKGLMRTYFLLGKRL